MSKAYISKALRARVTAQAQQRCGYCLTQQAIIGATLEIDHIIPETHGGLTEEANLWLACSLCNDYKGDRMVAPDPETGEVVALFDPRRQAWLDHFSWTDDGCVIVGLSPSGRATVIMLRLNRHALVNSRRLWVRAGWHPPTD